MRCVSEWRRCGGAAQPRARGAAEENPQVGLGNSALVPHESVPFVAGKIASNRFMLPGKRRHDDRPFSFVILSIFLRAR
ncbi:hypothetical protein ABQJ48_30805 [Paraburkholderia sp. DGU8]